VPKSRVRKRTVYTPPPPKTARRIGNEYLFQEMAKANIETLDGAVLVHCDRTPQDLVFGPQLRTLATSTGLRLMERHTSVVGRLTPDALAEAVPDWAARQTWACGPAGLLDALATHWERFGDPNALHVERFVPPTPAADAGVTGGSVTFTTSGITASSGPGTPVLVAGEVAGALLPNGCRMGICHTCVGTLRSGAVRDLRSGELHNTPGEVVRTCVTGAAGDVEIEL